MKQRTLVILGGAAAFSIVSALLLSPGNPEAPADAGALAFKGLASRLQGASRIEISKHDGKLVLERRGSTWVVADAGGGYPVRPERVRELLVGLTEMRLLEPRTADPALHERLGVDDPSKPGSSGLLLRVQDTNGAQVAELVVGRRRVRTQGNLPESAYVRRPAEAQSWLAEGRLPVDADPRLWLDRDVVNLPAARVREVTVRRANEPELVLAREETAEAKLALAAPAGFQAKDEGALDEVARTLEFVTFLEVKPEGERLGEALGETRFVLSEGMAIVAATFKDGDKLWLRLRAEGTGNGVGAEAERLNARWRGWAYQVSTGKEKALLPRLEDLGGRASTSDAASPPRPVAAGFVPFRAPGNAAPPPVTPAALTTPTAPRPVAAPVQAAPSAPAASTPATA
ncbi:DUF4340 domain-containing protein, partial [Craurococcus roseus]|uniref:DUF4340 domain-containing protein n=1 Tax=Craurococcus roseus TaxID=77585 RepID=UPI0031D6EDCA